MLKILALSVLLTASAVTVASADVVYNLQNVGFADGGIAAGTVTVNSAGTLSNFDVSVSGGDTGSFPAFTYDLANSSTFSFSALGDLIYVLEDSSGSQREVRFAVATALSPTGGTYNIVSSNTYAGECFNCSPYRPFNSGGTLSSMPTSVPEPASFAILGTGLIGLGLLRRRG